MGLAIPTEDWWALYRVYNLTKDSAFVYQNLCIANYLVGNSKALESHPLTWLIFFFIDWSYMNPMQSTRVDVTEWFQLLYGVQKLFCPVFYFLII